MSIPFRKTRETWPDVGLVFRCPPSKEWSWLSDRCRRGNLARVGIEAMPCREA